MRKALGNTGLDFTFTTVSLPFRKYFCSLFPTYFYLGLSSFRCQTDTKGSFSAVSILSVLMMRSNAFCCKFRSNKEWCIKLQASFGRKMAPLWPTQPSRCCTSGVVQHLLSSEQVVFEMKTQVWVLGYPPSRPVGGKLQAPAPWPAG